MNRILASSVGLTTILLVAGCGGSGQPSTNYSRAAANATDSPGSTDLSPYPESSPNGTDMSPGYTSPGATPSESGSMAPMPVPEHAKLKVVDSKFGKILVGEMDRTLYVFDKDKEDTSNCYDACAAMWPPLITKDKPEAGPDVKNELLGTATRKQGEKQVTYNKHPLYYYSGDKKAGDLNGQAKEESGGKWHVVGPDGKKVE